MSLDSHQHFWRYDPVDYPWISPAMGALRRDFLPADLALETTRVGIAGVVAVQARQTVAETAWLLDLAAKHDLIRGVVGWLPLAAATIEAELAGWTRHPKLKGVRHVVQDEPDDEFLLRPEFNRGIRALRPHGLVYDILIFERHLPTAIRFVDAHPEQVFVLDHLGKPRVSAATTEPWGTRLRELAERPNVYAKISGLVTEADHLAWTEPQLRRHFDAALAAFGPRRLMFGSDWPVCLLASSYARWHATVQGWIAGLSQDEQARLLGETAAAVYRL